MKVGRRTGKRLKKVHLMQGCNKFTICLQTKKTFHRSGVGSGRYVQKIFLPEIVQFKNIVYLHDAGACMAFGDLGGKVATFETDKTMGDGEALGVV